MRCSSWARPSSGPSRGRRSAASSIDGPDDRSAGGEDQLLAAGPQLQAAVDLGGVVEGEARDGEGVLPGLEESRHELQLVRPDDRAGLLQAEIGLEPPGQQVRVALPPAGRVRLAGQREELVPLGLRDKAVEREQVGDVALLETHAPELEPADLGRRRPDGVAGLLAAHARGLAAAAQLATEGDASGGRPVSGPALGAIGGDATRHLVEPQDVHRTTTLMSGTALSPRS